MKDLVNHLFKNIAQVTVKHVFQIGDGPVEKVFKNGPSKICGRQP